jgi:hypothetical protein
MKKGDTMPGLPITKTQKRAITTDLDSVIKQADEWYQSDKKNSEQLLMIRNIFMILENKLLLGDEDNDRLTEDQKNDLWYEQECHIRELCDEEEEIY